MTDLLALIGVEAPTWMQDAVCAQTDPEIFFPEKGGSTAAAKRVCADCTVQAECLDYALQGHGEPFGIWGGLSVRERRPIAAAMGLNHLDHQESA